MGAIPPGTLQFRFRVPGENRIVEHPVHLAPGEEATVHSPR
jgi:hypothetical protein